MPCEANKNKTIECDNTITKADNGDNLSKSFPAQAGLT